MPSDRALSAETRAAKMAADDIRKTIDTFKGDSAPFMGAKHSASTEARRALIMSSPAARDLLAQGHPMALAERVARMDREELKDNPLRDILPDPE